MSNNVLYDVVFSFNVLSFLVIPWIFGLCNHSIIVASSSLFSEACGDAKEDAVKPSMTACHRVIQLTRVFTWHSSSLRVSRRASMCTSYAMMASRVTPYAEEEGAKVDGEEEAGGVTVSVRGHFGRSWASLRLTVAASVAQMTWKCGDSG